MHFKEKGGGANNQNIWKLINKAASFALTDKEVSIPENGEVSSYRTLHRFLFFYKPSACYSMPYRCCLFRTSDSVSLYRRKFRHFPSKNIYY